MLTGKAKEQFRLFYNTKYQLTGLTIISGNDLDKVLLKFNQLPFEMKFGVYVDFFDSVGVEIEIIKINSFWWIVINGEEQKELNTFIKKSTRPEAKEEAILKANEIYNKQ